MFVSEITQQLYLTGSMPVFGKQHTAFSRIDYLCRMQAGYGDIPIFKKRFSFVFNTHGMAGIINHTDFIFFCDAVYFINITWVSVNMYGKNSCCIFTYFLSYLFGINVKSIRINICKNRLTAFPNY